MINLHESMVPGGDRTRDPWICSHTRICSQTRYRLRYAARLTTNRNAGYCCTGSVGMSSSYIRPVCMSVLLSPDQQPRHHNHMVRYDSQNKDKNITIKKIKSLLFFHAVYYIKNHVISHPVITTLKDNNNMSVKFSKYNRKLSNIVNNCEFDFRLHFALNGGHLRHHLHYFYLVNQTRECFILIVCIVRPLNIDKKSKLKCSISSF